MKKYNARIINKDEIRKIFNMNRDFVFSNGFAAENRIDWWGILEKYLNEPVISVRPSGRTGWNEIIILTANGYIKPDGSCVLDYKTKDELTTVLTDIFAEADNDEYEVFEQYLATCSDEVWNEVNKWVHETY